MRAEVCDARTTGQPELRQIVETALVRTLYLAGRKLRFEVREEGLVLQGVVRSYYQKQLAQESLKAIAGMPRIHNEIEVVSV